MLKKVRNFLIKLIGFIFASGLIKLILGKLLERKIIKEESSITVREKTVIKKGKIRLNETEKQKIKDTKFLDLVKQLNGRK